ncbi:hypothetical protein [Lysobacter gummosus]|uniref:hypothetical protein n=1 Tax=Lysobacter gummosus TaxID=262324 RepID=UPI0036311C20
MFDFFAFARMRASGAAMQNRWWIASDFEDVGASSPASSRSDFLCPQTLWTNLRIHALASCFTPYAARVRPLWLNFSQSDLASCAAKFQASCRCRFSASDASRCREIAISSRPWIRVACASRCALVADTRCAPLMPSPRRRWQADLIRRRATSASPMPRRAWASAAPPPRPRP